MSKNHKFRSNVDTPKCQKTSNFGQNQSKTIQNNFDRLLFLKIIISFKNLHKEGVFASYTDNFYSFVGASQQSAIINTYAPKWAKMLISQNVDAVLLVAA